MTTYFFACSYPLEAGSIVRAGNWGRIVRMYRTNGFGNAWILFREEVFECIRKTEYPLKPSRYDGIFLCETKDHLMQFLDVSKRPLDLIYEISLVDDSAPIHRGCLSHLDFSFQENFETFSIKARAYWIGDNIQRPEILTTSGVRIIAQV